MNELFIIFILLFTVITTQNSKALITEKIHRQTS